MLRYGLQCAPQIITFLAQAYQELANVSIFFPAGMQDRLLFCLTFAQLEYES